MSPGTSVSGVAPAHAVVRHAAAVDVDGRAERLRRARQPVLDGERESRAAETNPRRHATRTCRAKATRGRRTAAPTRTKGRRATARSPRPAASRLRRSGPRRPAMSTAKQNAGDAQETELAGVSGVEIVTGGDTAAPSMVNARPMESSAAQNVGATHDTAWSPAPTRTGWLHVGPATGHRGAHAGDRACRTPAPRTRSRSARADRLSGSDRPRTAGHPGAAGEAEHEAARIALRCTRSPTRRTRSGACRRCPIEVRGGAPRPGPCRCGRSSDRRRRRTPASRRRPPRSRRCRASSARSSRSRRT